MTQAQAFCARCGGLITDPETLVAHRCLPNRRVTRFEVDASGVHLYKDVPTYEQKQRDYDDAEKLGRELAKDDTAHLIEHVAEACRNVARERAPDPPRGGLTPAWIAFRHVLDELGRRAAGVVSSPSVSEQGAAVEVAAARKT